MFCSRRACPLLILCMQTPAEGWVGFSLPPMIRKPPSCAVFRPPSLVNTLSKPFARDFPQLRCLTVQLYGAVWVIFSCISATIPLLGLTIRTCYEDLGGLIERASHNETASDEKVDSRGKNGEQSNELHRQTTTKMNSRTKPPRLCDN